VAAGALLPAYGIALSPSLAGGMMALSSIAVVSNSLSLRWTIDAAAGSANALASTDSSSSSSTAAAGSQQQLAAAPSSSSAS